MNRNVLIKLLLLSFMLLILSACKESKQGNEKTWVEGNCDSQDFANYRNAAYCESGYYYLGYSEADDMYACNRIYYADKSLGKSTPLCSKPDCNHEDMNCNAVYIQPVSICYYNKYIYVVDYSEDRKMIVLYKMNQEGSTREKVADLMAVEEQDCSSTPIVTIHRGFVFMSMNWNDISSSQKRRQSLYCMPVEGGDKEEIYTVEGYEPIIYQLCSDGDNIYFTSSWSDESSLSEIKEDTVQYNVADGEVHIIDPIEGRNIDAVHNGRIYTIYRDYIPGSPSTEIEFYSADMEGGDNKQVYKADISTTIINRTSNYRFIVYTNSDYEERLLIMDYDGNVIQDIENVGVIWAGPEDMLVNDSSSGNDELCIYDIKTMKKTMITEV